MNGPSDHAFTLFLLLNLPGVGPARVNTILQGLKDQEQSIPTDLKDVSLLQPYLNEQQYQSLDASRTQLEAEWNYYQSQGIEFISSLDDLYPSRLTDLLGKNTPPLLSIRGNRDLLKSPSIGFCGSRKASEKGLAVACECAEALVEKGINVTSGYAKGVDLATHKTTLTSGGTTTIVLPEGIAHFSVKNEIKAVWDWNRVVIVSEFLPKTKWSVGNAMRRNSTIIALSHAMILIEARDSGGSYEAGLSCLKFGLPLFSINYEGTPETAEGNRILLEKGARSLGRNIATLKPNIQKVLQSAGLTSELNQEQTELVKEDDKNSMSSQQLVLL